jgi:hypothetical protein
MPNAAGYVDFDVTSVVNAELMRDGLVTLGVSTNSGSSTSFNTRENSTNKPLLVINSTEAIPPAMTASAFSYLASPPRVQLGFSENVASSLSLADIVLQNLTTGQTIASGSMSLNYDGPSNVATITFPGYPGDILPDGNYQTTLGAAGVADAAQNPLPANQTLTFFFLTADANHDKSVDTADFNILAANFGVTGADYSDGDFNYSGNVDSIDFNLLAANFEHALPADVQALDRPRAAGASVFSQLCISRPVHSPGDLINDLLV